MNLFLFSQLSLEISPQNANASERIGSPGSPESDGDILGILDHSPDMLDHYMGSGGE